MAFDPKLISLDDDTAYLRKMEDKGFSKAEIAAERDHQFQRHFGFTRDELVAPIPPTVLMKLANETYDEIVSLAEWYGFDITSSRSKDGVLLRYEEDDEDDFSPKIMSVAKMADYWTTPLVAPPTDTHGYVIRHWREWAEMIMAIELELLPKTEAQLAQVALAREVKNYSRKAERDRHKPKSRDDEKMAVFGRAVGFRPGTITPVARKAKPGPIRQVVVEVKSKRLLPKRHGSPR